MSEHAVSQRELERELLRYPLTVTEEFRRAWGALEPRVSRQELVQWGRLGVGLAQQTVRAWEAATEYFRVSPQVLGTLTFPQLHRWAALGVDLCDASPTLAAAYFRRAPGVVTRLDLPQLAQWAELGQQLYRGTWKSSSLACKFLEASPGLLEHVTFPDLQRFADLLARLSEKSYDLAGECVALAPQVFPQVGEQWDSFLRLGNALLGSNWRELRSYFEVVAKVLHRVAPDQRSPYLEVTAHLVLGGLSNVAAFLNETSEALDRLEPRTHSRVLGLAEALLAHHAAVIPDFLRFSPMVLSRVNPDRLEVWVREGTRVLEENSEGGLAYFRLESSRAVEVLDALSSGVELARVREVLSLYCRALAGARVELLPTQDLVNRSIGWTTEARATTEGAHVYLPEMVDRYPTKADNFQWLKVVATHQVAHLEFASFDFQYDRSSALFQDQRPRRAFQAIAGEEAQAPRQGDNGAPPSMTDMERFFDLFHDRKLALDIFTAVEDGRLDARVQREYRGLREAYVRVQRDTLRERPLMEDLPARQAMVEFLVRLSLQQFQRVSVPQRYASPAQAIARIFRRLLAPVATVEDTAEATLRIYAIIQKVPNQEVNDEQWESLNTGEGEDSTGDLSEEELQELLAAQPPEASSEKDETELPYQSPQAVDYRGDFKPELTQLLARLQQEQEQWLQNAAAEPISRELLEKILEKSAELNVVPGEITQSSHAFANNLMREAGFPRMEPQFGYGPHQHTEEEGGPLEASGPQAFLYDEWDFRANDYKPRWCMVHERELEEGAPEFYNDTLQSYAGLAAQIRRQFELMVPELFRKVKHLPEGEEFDLDAVIEAQVDRRTGNPPSEKLFWRRNKMGRDVAVVFLLDMSASTAEAIDEARRFSPLESAPDDPVEYMIWLRTRRSEGRRRPFKRIIDLEKESTALLIHALETIGDTYGIYGFSGYGRENVEFYVIKDVMEPFSERVLRRLDKISPLHATRMGPAIRHAITKLEQVDTHTKLLFLLSDGRPQDRGYSREGVEKEYAVHDTRMALQEARRKEIVPFCLTVDKQGHDYLKTMCQDMGYEVLGDINALPQRLPLLYRRLTT